MSKMEFVFQVFLANIFIFGSLFLLYMSYACIMSDTFTIEEKIGIISFFAFVEIILILVFLY